MKKLGLLGMMQLLVIVIMKSERNALSERETYDSKPFANRINTKCRENYWEIKGIFLLQIGKFSRFFMTAKTSNLKT